ADVAFLAQTKGAGNFNEQGLGKTVEAIAAVFEAGLDTEPTIVIAPKTLLETVWELEVEKWTDDPVYVLSGDTVDWLTSIGKVMGHKNRKEAFWFVTTPDQVRKGLDNALLTTNWGTLIVDEFQKMGLTNISGDPTKGTQFGRAVRTIKRQKTIVQSG